MGNHSNIHKTLRQKHTELRLRVKELSDDPEQNLQFPEPPQGAEHLHTWTFAVEGAVDYDFTFLTVVSV